MEKKEVINRLDQLNKIIIGNRKMIEAIDGKIDGLDERKVVKTILKGQIVISDQIKFIIDDIIKNRDEGEAGSESVFSDILKGFGV